MTLTTATTLVFAALAGGPDADAAAETSLTYSRDIAPIFQKRCQECHRPGEVAPMSLLEYKDAREWAKSIKKEVKARRMPPWHADPALGKWRNDPRLSDDEIGAIARWVDAGAPEGDPKDLPPPKEFPAGWRLGKPDAVLSMPVEFHVPAEGTVPYKYFTVPTGFTEDKWVRAVEVQRGNREVVHHIIVFVLPPAESRLRERGIWRRHLAGIAPGGEPDVYPPGCGKRIPAGSKLVFQMHYTPNGKEATDRSRIGLYFSEDEGRTPLRQVHVRAAMNPWLRIPPGASDHEVESSYTFRGDARVIALMPHMHLRGKSFLYEIERQDGRREKLLRVPQWDFNWQHDYAFAEPLQVKAGDKIRCTATYDNSANNKANPDPTKAVKWGDQTWEEMMIGFVAYVDEGQPSSEPSGDDDGGGE